jgi:hypothetical protein
VRKLVPELWDGKHNGYVRGGSTTPAPVLGASEKHLAIDIMIHIGMLPPDIPSYLIEKIGARDGYLQRPDVDGEVPKVGSEGIVSGWERYPSKLETEFNVEELLGRCKQELPVQRYPRHARKTQKANVHSGRTFPFVFRAMQANSCAISSTILRSSNC